MIDELEAVIAKAKKVLGDKAKVPAPKGAIEKGLAESTKAFKTFDKGRNLLEDQLLAVIDADAKVVDAIEQYRDVLDGSNFGLNEKDKEDAKKIGDARKMLMEFLDENLNTTKNNMKNERELNKHLAHIKTYKQETA